MENLIIFEKRNCGNFKQFVEFWSKFYSDNDNLYDAVINKAQFDENDIINLFIWKNGYGKLSVRKENSLQQKVINKLDIVNSLKKQFDRDCFENEFGKMSFVWKIFLMHIIQPDEFPIYDQNVHRAHNYIFGEKWEKISELMPEKNKKEFYDNVYLPYIQKQDKTLKIRDIDRALFIFGRSLKKNSFKIDITF